MKNRQKYDLRKIKKFILKCWPSFLAITLILASGRALMSCRPTEDRDPASLMDDYFNYTKNKDKNNNNQNDNNQENNQGNDQGGQGENENDPTPTPTPTSTPDASPTATPTPTSTPTPTPTPYVEDEEEDETGITDFSGITSVSEVSDTTARLSWNYHEQAYYYVLSQREIAPNEEENFHVVANLNADQTSIFLSNLKVNTTYSFRLKAYDRKGHLDTNNSTQTVQTTLAPAAPVSVMIKNPSTSAGFITTPTFTVRYVKPGETIRLYADSSCTQQLGSGIAAIDQVSIDIQTSALAVGETHEIYANTTSIYGYTSACSAAYATYLVAQCPEGYLEIEANDDLGTDPFCVMQTEAKKGENNIPVPAYGGKPWTNISPPESKAACQSLDFSAQGFTCDIISNPLWMAIARDIEAVAANWSGGEVGVGQLNRGHSDDDPLNSSLAIDDPTNPWTNTNNDESDWTQKRTHVLSNGSVIWDLAGNVEEFVDWTTGGDTFTPGPNTCAASSTELLALNCAALSPNDYMPLNPAGVAKNNYTAEKAGIGRFYGTGSGNRSATGGGSATRGERYGKGIKAGIFNLSLDSTFAKKQLFAGFRCVCYFE